MEEQNILLNKSFEEIIRRNQASISPLRRAVPTLWDTDSSGQQFLGKKGTLDCTFTASKISLIHCLKRL